MLVEMDSKKGEVGEERLGKEVTGYRFGSEVLNIPVWERMSEGETHYWNFRCPEILRLKLRGNIGKREKINSTVREVCGCQNG